MTEKYDKLRRKREIYSSASVIIRMDGNDFHNLHRELTLKAPFDERFHSAMIGTAEDLMTRIGIHISLSHTASDEVSILLLNEPSLPDKGRIEKLTSLMSSYTTFSLKSRLHRLFKSQALVSFNSRIMKVEGMEEIAEYFSWRTLSSFRNFLNGYAQHYLGRNQSVSSKGKQVIELLSTVGVDIDRVEPWQKYGTILYWQTVEKRGVDPKTQIKMKVRRRKLTTANINFDADENRKWLKQYLAQF